MATLPVDLEAILFAQGCQQRKITLTAFAKSEIVANNQNLDPKLLRENIRDKSLCIQRREAVIESSHNHVVEATALQPAQLFWHWRESMRLVATGKELTWMRLKSQQGRRQISAEFRKLTQYSSVPKVHTVEVTDRQRAAMMMRSNIV